MTGNGVDLEKYSITQGYKDTLEFLEHQMPELTVYYRKNRLKCVVRLMAGTAEKMLLSSVSSSSRKKLQGMMGVVEEDPAALKRNVLHLVLQHPEGVKFGNFSGAFQQLHGYHPQLALHGYRSLRNLLADMKDVVVLEGDSQNPVIKVASDLDLYQSRRRGGEENQLDDSEEKAQSLSYEEAAGENTEVLELITNLFSTYKPGLRIEKIQEFLLAKNGVDLEKFSIAQGYKDTLEFLEHQMPELTIRYQENRLKCVAHLAAGKLQELTAMEEADPAALKRNVLHMVLRHPEGVTFGDFHGAFQQLHGYPPKLTLHGYRSLRDLVADMKNFVVLEGDSQNPVIKVAHGSLFYRWLVGGEENGRGDSEGKAQSLSCEEAAGEDAESCGRTSKPGTSGIRDVETEAILFLSEFSIAFVAVRNVLKCQPKGLKVKKLKEALRETYRLDLERLRSGLGYKDIISFLQDMPGLLLRNSSSVRNCVVQLQSGPSSPVPSLDTDFSACNSNTAFQEPMRKESGNHISFFVDLAAALVLVLDVLGGCPLGLNLKALKENLETKHGFDLNAFSQGLGYEDVTTCLLDIPGLCMTYHSGKQPQDCTVQLLSSVPILPACLLSASHSLDKPLSSSGSNTLHQKPMERKPDPSISTSAEVSAPLSFNSKESSIRSETSSQRKTEKEPTLAEILALISSLLSSKGYEMGLRVKRLQELLLSKEEVDLEKFSIAQGHKDSLAFLECHMPELKIRYEENRLSCVLHRGSNCCISASTQVSAPLSFDSEESSIRSELSTQRNVEKKPAALEKVLAALSSLLSTKGYVVGLRLKKVQTLLLSKEGINLEKFSIAQGYKDSLAFLECHMPELKISYQEDRLKCVIQLGSGSCFSTSTQANTPPSFDSNQSSIKSETLNQRKMGKNPALEEVLALLSSLLSSKQYQSGLKLKKVQELLLTTEGFDLEKFSIAQGHKDSLAFVECHMPEYCLIRYQEDRLSCVLQLGSGCRANSVPLLHNAPVPLMKTVRTAKPENPPSAANSSFSLTGFGSISKHLSTSRDSSANRPWIQSLPAPSTVITPVSQDPHAGILGRDESPSQLQSGISARLLSECQLRRTPPTEELPSLSDAQQFRRSNLTGPHHAKDQDELKQEVAHILARHPEGVSLFQFRTEYSAAYQKHLPLGNASSAKQCLLHMPDVVCLKGYGVQTLLFPVSSKESSLKSGQQIMSRVEDAVVVPGHPVSKAVTMADPVLVFQPSLPMSPVRPQPHTINSLTSGHLGEPGKVEISVLPPSELPGAPKPRALLQEPEMARAKLGNPSTQSYLTNVTEAAAAHGCSLSEADPVVVPKSSAPKATVAPVPPPHPFPCLYSECFKPLSTKETCPGPETAPQRPPETASPEEEQVKIRPSGARSARPRGTHVLPPSPVVFPSDWGEMSTGFPSKPTHPAKPWASDKSIPAPSLSQPLPTSFTTWAQPLVFPPVMFLTPLPPSSASVHNTPRIQPQNVYQSSVPQTVPQVRPVQPVSPLHSAEQRNYVYVAPGPNAFSQEQMSSRTVLHAQSQAPVFAVDGLPVSSPSHNPSSSCVFRSQAIYHQTERYHHAWPDGPQCRSITSAVHNGIMTTPSARAPSQPAAYWNQSVGGNPFVTSPSTPLSSVPPAPTHVPQQPSYASSRISTRSDALASSDHCVSPHPLEPQTLSLNNRDPQAFVYTQRYTDVHSTISSVTTQSNSSPTSVSLPTQTSGQPSYTSYNSAIDYGASNHVRSLMATSKEAEKQDNHYVTWVDKQKPRLTQRPTESYSSAFQSSPPPKSSGKCVLL
ncbi:hypothetical protein lerEdw1_010216 [Lerista edwardsae]|nr:hypothetical protein lerEdw1_010216 [Lerista edwardsae]